MKRSTVTMLVTLCALSGSVPALAQSKGNTRDPGASKSEQSREPVRQKSREPAPSKSDQRRDNGGTASKSRR